MANSYDSKQVGQHKRMASGATTTGMKKGGFVPFEKSGKDKEVAGKGKEGSKREEKFDKGQMKKGGSSGACPKCGAMKHGGSCK